MFPALGLSPEWAAPFCNTQRDGGKLSLSGEYQRKRKQAGIVQAEGSLSCSPPPINNFGSFILMAANGNPAS